MTQGYRFALLAFFALALCLGAGLSSAEHASSKKGDCKHRHGKQHHRSYKIIEENAQELGIAPETVETITKLHEESKEARTALREQISDGRDQIHELLEQDPPDEAAIMNQIEAIGAIEIKLHKERISTMLKVHALLTPEQREGIQRIREEASKPCANKECPKKPCTDKECPNKPCADKECPKKPCTSKECPNKPCTDEECPRHKAKEHSH